MKYGLFAFNLTEITVPAHFDKTRNFFASLALGSTDYGLWMVYKRKHGIKEIFVMAYAIKT